jgi:predicted dithiol-disulfide oxidoreductase (DUF899 family)
MALPEVVSREEWLKARRELLAEEKKLTRRRDRLNARRRELPMVRVEQEYIFDGPAGPVSLAGLFGSLRQLVVQHVTFGPDRDAACPSCTEAAGELTASLVARLRSRDTAYAMVCRAPLDRIEAYRAGRGWVVPWYSSYASSFNYDFPVTLDPLELPGASCFLLDGGEIFHTYSAYARGLDHVDFAYADLDLTAFGRPAARELPGGRAPVIHGTL